MQMIKAKNYQDMSRIAANIIAVQLNKKPGSVLGFATGSTPLGTYRNLIEMYRNGLADFSEAVTFNLDEYCGLSRKDPQSYYYFMMKNLFRYVNIKKKNVHVPDGMAEDFGKECLEYENRIKKAGGIDLQLLGIGRNGHIGFNEPGDVFYHYTRQVQLTESTIEANKRFFDRAEDVPKTALSMGIKTIMSAREILVVAGPDKAEMIGQLKNEVCTPQIPVSVLHYHPSCTVLWAEND